MPLLRWQSAVDFVVLAAAIYFLLIWARRTRALRIAFVILALYAGSQVARNLDLVITSWVLSGASLIAIVMLAVVFQPELRRALTQLDTVFRLGLDPLTALTPVYRAIAEAVFSMARQRLGGLIVIARAEPLLELSEGGIRLGAEVAAPLIEAIFRKDSPIHDGAIVVETDRISGAGLVLPLTSHEDVPLHFGTRHRAAMGIAERSDALAIVVSEERGEVTLMEGSRVLPVESPAALIELLQAYQTTRRVSAGSKVKKAFRENLRYKLASVGLAALIWGSSFLATGGTVRTLTVPVEFASVPTGMEISRQTAKTVEVQLRGNPLVMGSVGLVKLVARFDLGGAEEGSHTLSVDADVLRLPPGVILERVSPPSVTLRLSRSGP